MNNETTTSYIIPPDWYAHNKTIIFHEGTDNDKVNEEIIMPGQRKNYPSRVDCNDINSIDVTPGYFNRCKRIKYVTMTQ
jgi:hypothetical protein